MLKIGDKTFLNLQEAVAWLMENNCIPFQCTAPYAANTEIGMGTLVNPSPAKVRIGSIIFFSDSKVSTVTGITQNGFIVSDKYNDLVDDVVYVSNVAINASGHLIVTLSDGQNIDAGQVKMINGFSISGAQHLIASYNDGTSEDLGAIFSGNVNIAGNLTADSIIENMAGYSMALVAATPNITIESTYGGIVKNGNKLTIALAGKITRTAALTGVYVANITIPSAVGAKLFPMTGSSLSYKTLYLAKSNTEGVSITTSLTKQSNSQLRIEFYMLVNMVESQEYVFRFEETFLLSDNMLA